MLTGPRRHDSPKWPENADFDLRLTMADFVGHNLGVFLHPISVRVSGRALPNVCIQSI